MFSVWETKRHAKDGELIGQYRTLRGAKIGAHHLCDTDSLIEILNGHYVVAIRTYRFNRDGEPVREWVNK